MANQAARRLRTRPTVAERILWDELRQLRRQGYHFRRQAPIAGYIVDFACLGQRLIVEVDGVGHETPQHQASDSARDAHLRHLGFTIVRITNGEVMGNLDGVVMEVLASLGAVTRHE